jgi:hypothetical protein
MLYIVVKIRVISAVVLTPLLRTLTGGAVCSIIADSILLRQHVCQEAAAVPPADAVEQRRDGV